MFECINVISILVVFVAICAHKGLRCVLFVQVCVWHMTAVVSFKQTHELNNYAIYGLLYVIIILTEKYLCVLARYKTNNVE